MNFSKITLLFFILFLVNPFITSAQTDVNEKEARTLVTLLDYIAKDYEGAVADGKIINEAEFEEIAEFTQTCITYHENLVPQVNSQVFVDLRGELENLKKLIQTKADQESIETQARDIKEKILDLGLIKITPDQWPSLKSGMMIYNDKCQSCHGSQGKGDGILAGSLDPAPTNFQEPGTLKNLTAVQAYNVAKLGLEGTAMRSFAELSEAELWDVSFYIMSLSHPEADNKLASLPAGINLDSVSKWTDQQLETSLAKADQQVTLNQIRHYEPERVLPLDIASNNLDASLQAYLNKDKRQAQQLALSSYLEGVEIVENTLKAVDKNIVITIEKAMLAYRNALKGDDEALVRSTYSDVNELIIQAQGTLDNNSYSFGFTFWAALSILLREALEALLIIIVILSILRPLKIKKAIKFLHLGWIAALVIGIISWFFVDQLVKISGSSREMMEGVGSLIAVFVLIFMGTWLHSKSEIKKWKEFIEVKINKISKSGNWWGLMLFSFIVVFREAFEVILFLTALKLDIPEGSGSPIGWALLTSTAIIIVFTILMMYYSKRLPIKQIFKISALTMAILAVVLVGKGFSALQEAGVIEMSLVSDWLRFEPLGIYPTVQSLAAQIVTILLTIVLWIYADRPKQDLSAIKSKE
ncbi:FTR1 family protein [Albibacterium bauzanense]|uniref:High-affinity iron transporter n=1 Tax=Albibacterium bauzanense TaxID=653929 RepID=A0A4R1LPQ7_9SPHI|nr:FTR1 family protein [Albibacterium bauzanense]TCK80825.1 high-affinity iron transporter [Albibacterium bauzanense]